VKLPGSDHFVLLTHPENLPPGTTVDVSGKAAIELADPKGNEMVFYGQPDGVPSRFIYAVVGAGYVRLVLTGGSFSRFARSAASLTKAKKPVRRLWGSGKGKFSTKGRYAAATVRGTIWETADFKDGTLVLVKRGIVAVQDLVKHKTVLVKAGHSYFAVRRTK
jgi:hypothetical protein